MSDWITKCSVYHIYPFGFCGCERFHSDAGKESVNRISKVIEWIPHLKKLHIGAVYFGPVFESVAHGYDTTDYKKIDIRLGSNEDFSEVCKALHDNGIKIILDGVFNHVGRGHFAFEDVIRNRQNSRYCSWFKNLNFGGNSSYNDGFWYEGWNNCYDLVKLNLDNPEVRNYLIDAVDMWIDTWDIDGIRFDAADCLPEHFIKEICAHLRQKKSDIWLMGEIIHGNYSRWANSEMFDSVTNYQCYKGIYSSHNDRNYFEIAHSIEYSMNQYGNIYMYNFVDNHDVSRLASILKNPEHIYCVYTLLYMMYGVPSVYYGSEFAVKGEKGKGELADAAIRPCLELDNIPYRNDMLVSHISSLGAIREQIPAVQTGKYYKMELKNQTFSFKRELNGDEVYVLLNISDNDYTFCFDTKYSKLADRLSGKQITVNNGKAQISVPSNRSAILVNDEFVHEIIEEETKTEEEKPVEKSSEIYEKSEPKSEIVPEKKEEAPMRTKSLGVPNGRKLVVGGHYKHFKGGDYLVLSLAKDHETFEDQVVYAELNNKAIIWVRPLKLFLDMVDDHGNAKQRFELVE